MLAPMSPPQRLCLWYLAWVFCAPLSPAEAADADADAFAPGQLDPVVVSARGVSDMPAASAGDVDSVALSALPVLRPAAILETVPGLIVTQHSGEGKANQYFLRAFNLDHGTDLATVVDGMPVNLVSHAHGQGYSDLNFLIPETVGNLHYRKGPYYADSGDFSAAGSVRLAFASRFDPDVAVGAGTLGYQRALALTSWDSSADSRWSAAAEGYHNDGPFDVPDNYRRDNLLLRYAHGADDDRTTVTALHYDGRWNSTDQVSSHLIDEGIIDRFGSLAPTDGGVSHRDSLSFARHVRDSAGSWDVSGYVIGYALDLYSTFTDHLVDATNGDQMLQHDRRTVSGFKADRRLDHTLADRPSTTVIGVDVRYDDIGDVGIDHTLERRVLSHTQDAAVREVALGAYVENRTLVSAHSALTLALRSDTIDFRVTDRRVAPDGQCSIATDPLGCNTGHRRASLLSPKLGVSFGPYGPVTAYANVADGFHSNDARGVTRSGENPDVPAATPLVRARSAEAGVVIDVPHWHTALDVYRLQLASELVFSGDAGDTAPSGATTRRGIELSERYAFNDALQVDLNGAYSRGRFDQNAPADDLGCGAADPAHPCATPIAIVGREIPNSPTLIVDGGITYAAAPLTASLRVRHFGRSPLVEDGSLTSPAYTTLDARLGWSFFHWRASVDLFNLANARWNDITYAYVARHPGEAYATPDTVIHPGTPRTVRVSIGYRF